MVLQQALRVVEQGNPIIFCPFPPLDMTYILQSRVFMCRNRLICRCRILNKCYRAHDSVIMEQDGTASRLFSYSFVMNEHRPTLSHKLRSREFHSVDWTDCKPSIIIDSPERVTNTFAEIWTVADGNKFLLKFLLSLASFAFYFSQSVDGVSIILT
jgi:hypothetical protein